MLLLKKVSFTSDVKTTANSDLDIKTETIFIMECTPFTFAQQVFGKEHACKASALKKQLPIKKV